MRPLHSTATGNRPPAERRGPARRARHSRVPGAPPGDNQTNQGSIDVRQTHGRSGSCCRPAFTSATRRGAGTRACAATSTASATGSTSSTCCRPSSCSTEARDFAAEVAGQGRHGALRRHQEAGARLGQGVGRALRDAVRQPALARRPADQLPDDLGADRPPARAQRAARTDGQLDLLPTKERMSMEAELEKLEYNLGGVRDMKRLPQAALIIDLKTEAIAVARRAAADPDPRARRLERRPGRRSTIPIPGNDDSMRSCELVISTIGEAVEDAANAYREARGQAPRRGGGAPPGRGGGEAQARGGGAGAQGGRGGRREGGRGAGCRSRRRQAPPRRPSQRHPGRASRLDRRRRRAGARAPDGGLGARTSRRCASAPAPR